MAYEVQQDRFLAVLRERGGSAGNGAMRDALGWAKTTYDRVKRALLEGGLIKRGQGKGGSVLLVAPPVEPRKAPAAPRLAAVSTAPRPAVLAPLRRRRWAQAARCRATGITILHGRTSPPPSSSR
jgi:hypothetical protein